MPDCFHSGYIFAFSPATYESFICSESLLALGIVISKSYSNRCIVVFNYDLICISLMISHVEHLFRCAYLYLLWWVVCSYIFSFWKWGCFLCKSLLVFLTPLFSPKLVQGLRELRRCWFFCNLVASCIFLLQTHFCFNLWNWIN